MFVDRRKIITCAHCHQKGRHAGHNWCARCYRNWWNQGKPKGGPRPKDTDRSWANLEGLKRASKERSEYCASIREEYFEFREDFDMSVRDAAARVGRKYQTAMRWEQEKKRNERSNGNQ